MKKYLLIYNPSSGQAKYRLRLDETIHYFQQRQALIIPYRTYARDETGCHTEWVDLAVEYGVDGILAAGGDGTIHEVVNVMLKFGLNIPLGIIPHGTCNDFSTHLFGGKKTGDSLKRIVDGNWRMVDVGLVNGSYFLNVAGAGLWTTVAYSVDPILKNTLGKMAYYIKGLGELPNFRTLHMRINADGQVLEEEVILFLIMNSGMVGSFPYLAPDAAIDDGKLDLLLVNKCGIPELMGLLLSIFSGKHTQSPHLTYLQAANIHIECDEPTVSDLDGELGPQLPLTISTVANRLRVFC